VSKVKVPETRRLAQPLSLELEEAARAAWAFKEPHKTENELRAAAACFRRMAPGIVFAAYIGAVELAGRYLASERIFVEAGGLHLNWSPSREAFQVVARCDCGEIMRSGGIDRLEHLGRELEIRDAYCEAERRHIPIGWAEVARRSWRNGEEVTA
jgi:hypothetical protein